MTEFMCYNCPYNKKENCGPFDTNWDSFKRYESVHKNCPGWQVKEETLQEMAQQFMVENGDAMISSMREKFDMLKEDVFENIVKVLEKEVIDEHDNIIQIAITILSAYTNNPQNLRILAPSGEGKTYLVNQVSNLFPTDNILMLSSATPKAFNYLATKKIVEVSNNKWEDYDKVVAPLYANAETVVTAKATYQKLNLEQKKELASIEERSYLVMDFTNKTLIFLDNQSFQLWESLKTTLSHDREYTKSFTVNKTKSTGTATTTKVVFRGWPAVIYCSAKDEISQDKTDEINTRFNTISIKGKPEKYRAMLNIQALKAGLVSPIYDTRVSPIIEKEKIRTHVELVIEEIKKYAKEKQPILNMYSVAISDKFKNDAGFRARQLATFMSNVQVITLANARMRPKFAMNDKLYPITIRADIKMANMLTHEPSPIPLTKLQYFNKNIRPILLKYGKDKESVYGYNTKSLTAREIADNINIDSNIITDRKKLLENYLEPLVEHGYLEAVQDPDHKSQYLYNLTPRYTKEEAVLESTLIDESTMDDSCLNVFKENYLNVDSVWKIIDIDGIEVPDSKNAIANLISRIDNQSSSYKNFHAYYSNVDTSIDVDFKSVDNKSQTNLGGFSDD